MAGLLPLLMQQEEGPEMDTTAFLLSLVGNQLGGAANARPSMPMPSGKDVVGLGTRGTSDLLNRLQQNAQFEASLQANEEARRERQLQGLGETVFRAREQERLQRERLQASKEQQATAQQRWETEQAMGNIRTLPDGSQVRVYLDPETGELQQESFAEAPVQIPTVRNFGDGSTRQYSPDTGDWDILAQRPQAGGGAGAGATGGDQDSLGQLAYAVNNGILTSEQAQEMLRQSGRLPPEQQKNFLQRTLSALPGLVQGGFEQTQQLKQQQDEAQRKQQEALQKQTVGVGTKAFQQALGDGQSPQAAAQAMQQAMGAYEAALQGGEAVPQQGPIDQAYAGLLPTVRGSRKQTGEALLRQGYAPEEVVSFVDAMGLSDDNAPWWPGHGEQWQPQGQQQAQQPQPQENTFTGPDGGVYRDNGDGTATRIQ